MPKKPYRYIPYPTEQEWHELRQRHIGASEAAALFGLSPYQTYWALWMEKSSRLEADDLSGNERVVLGHELEGGIASAARQILDMQLFKARRYCSSRQIEGWGCSPDYFVGSGHGWEPVEIKLVGADVFYTEWPEADDTRIPPAHILIQLQSQIGILGAERGYILALVGGTKLHLVPVDRHEGLIGGIKDRVVEFWQSIKENREPEPDYSRDLPGLQRLYLELLPDEVDATGDIELAALVNEYADAQADRRAAEKREAEAKAKIIDHPDVRGAAVVKAAGAFIKSKVREYKDGPRRDTRINLSSHLRKIIKENAA